MSSGNCENPGSRMILTVEQGPEGSDVEIRNESSKEANGQYNLDSGLRQALFLTQGHKGK